MAAAHIWLALVLAFAAGIAVGIVMERIACRFLEEDHRERVRHYDRWKRR